MVFCMAPTTDQVYPHRRRNPLTGQWVLVSPHRDRRPWQGDTENAPAPQPEQDEACYLCPGNTRSGGETNPDYSETWVFDNDFPALLEQQHSATTDDSLFQSSPVSGTCRVICYSPRHNVSLGQLPPKAIRAVIDTWSAQLDELQSRYRWVQIFENRGMAMGCSNHHPHGQIWAGDALPNEPALEDRHQHDYLEECGHPLLIDYAQRERDLGERIVCGQDDWIALVPWWATWPFETLVMPVRPVQRLNETNDGSREALAALLKRLLGAYDQLFDTPFPYSMGWHGAPGTEDSPHWQLHAHFYPPLLRSATVRKFMVGYEMLAEAQRDITPETAAARLRKLAGEAA
jgi:UDPglucose--hexose-1-phosphate uridylyltransferase